MRFGQSMNEDDPCVDLWGQFHWSKDKVTRSKKSIHVWLSGAFEMIMTKTKTDEPNIVFGW